MNWKLILSFFWFCAIVFPAMGQHQVDLNVLTVDEGLSQNLVTILHTDSRGFLWIGTNDGLNRFDGYENRIFRRSISDSTTISSNSIYSLAETSDNRIVIGHNNGQISIWHPQESRFRRYTNHVSSIPATTNDVIFNLTVSENDDIYALLDSGILRFNPTSDQFDFISLPVETPSFRGIFAEADSTLLIFSFQHTIHRYHIETGQFENLPSYTEKPIGPAQEFTAIGGNRYAIVRLGFIYIYDAVLHQTISKVEFPYLISAITYDGTRLWVSGEGIHVHYWLPETPGHIPVLVSPAVQGVAIMPQVRDIAVSNDGIIWIGTLGYGLSKLYDTSIWFGHLRSDTKTSNAIISTSTRALFPLNAHEILIGGYGGLERYDFHRMQTHALLGGDSGNKMYFPFSIIADPNHDSVIWIGTEGEGLLRMDLSNVTYQKFVQRDGQYESNIINDLQWISETRLMLATTAGLRIFDTETQREIYVPSNTELPQVNISFIKQFSDDVFHVGAVDGTLFRITKTGSEFNVEQLLGRELDMFRFISMTKDSRGDYWLGTDNGVIHLDHQYQILKNYTTEAGLPNNTIYSVQFDKLGYLWMSTNYGISRMNTQTLQFTNFTNRDGLQSNEFNTRSFANYESEIMFLGGIQGVNYFNPEKIVLDERTHEVYIEKVNAPSGEYRVGSTAIHLPFTDSQVRVQFTSPVFYNPRASKSWYRFVNIDTTWQRNPLQNELILAGLQPGTYQLQLARSSEPNLHQAPVSEVWFRIQTPFYKLWYVQMGVIFVVVGLVAFSINSYLQKLRNTIEMSRKYSRQLILFQDEERRRVAEALHDSIGSKLMLVKLSFRQVLMTVKDDFAEQKYQEINSLIGETVTEIREISQNIHPHLLEKIGVSKSIEALLESLQEMAQIQFTWTIDNVDDLLTAEEALLYYRFIQEGITNVLKHSEANQCRVLVAVDRKQGILLTEIRDNGVGISNLNWSEPGETMGLRSFEERAVHLRAEFDIDTQPGIGTTVKLRKLINPTK